MISWSKKNNAMKRIIAWGFVILIIQGQLMGMQQEYVPFYYAQQEGVGKTDWTKNLVFTNEGEVKSPTLLVAAVLGVAAILFLIRYYGVLDRCRGKKISFFEWKRKCDLLPKYGEVFFQMNDNSSKKTPLTASMLMREINECCQNMSAQLKEGAWLDGEIPSDEFFQIHKKSAFRYYSIESYVQKLESFAYAKFGIHGDFHGDIESINNCIESWTKQGYMDAEDPFKIIDPYFNILFLGDYTDRGYHGAEVIYAISRLKNSNPGRVFMVRGNHEEKGLNEEYGFKEELESKFPNQPKLYSTIYRWYDFLPLALFIGSGNTYYKDFVQCCHGGIEIGYDPRRLLHARDACLYQKITTLKMQTGMKILSSGLPIDSIGEEIMLGTTNGFMWGDFIVNSKEGLRVSHRGTGLLDFGKKATDTVLDEWSTNSRKLRGIFRAHQHADDQMVQRLLNEDGLGHPDDRGFAKLWIDQLPMHKDRPGMLNGVKVVTFCVSPQTGYGFGRDVAGLLTLADQYDDWRLQAQHIN